ncbi:MAG: putative quinol monooxygenase [Arenicellales bacterium WSBS_2016_MAG_OTU3]
MTTQDTCVSIHPYFTVHEGKMDDFKAGCNHFIAKTKTEDKCHYYGFSFNGNTAYCREAYHDAEGLLQHLGNVDAELKAAFKISDLTRVEIHGSESELAKLRKPLAALPVEWFVLEYGFRN